MTEEEAQLPDELFFQMPAEHVMDVWSLIRPGIMSGVDRSRGRMTEHSTARNIISGKWQLWTYWKNQKYRALAITQIIICDSGIKALEGIICTGEDKELWEKYIPETLTAFAKAEGCKIFEMWARPGWEKALAPIGFKKTHVLLEKEI